MTNRIKSFYSLSSNNCSLVVDCRGDSPVILYWGSRLADTTSPDMLALLATSQELQASLPQEAPIGLSPQSAAGLVVVLEFNYIVMAFSGLFILELNQLA